VADVVEGLVDRPSPAIPDGLEIGIVILEADGEVLLSSSSRRMVKSFFSELRL
jgi:hypothetical protein